MLAVSMAPPLSSPLCLCDQRELLILVFSPCTGVYCNRTWDGWLCWNDVAAGTESMQHCPDYFQDFDPSGKSRLLCTNLTDIFVTHSRLSVRFLLFSLFILKKKLRRSVTKMETGLDIQQATERGQITPGVM